jgi:hypothetical protein
MMLSVTPRNRYTFYLEDDDRDALRAIKQRDGISESEQIRRAIKTWIQARGGTTVKAERGKRAKRSPRS